MNLTLRFALRAAFGAAALAAPLLVQAQATGPRTYPLPTVAQQAIIDKDTSRHFGDAPTEGGPYANDLSAALEPAALDKALKKVADRELSRFQPYFERIWTSTTLYVGFLAASEATGDPTYRKAVAEMARKFDYQPRGRMPDADNLSIGQVYLDLYFLDGARSQGMLRLTRMEMDDLINLDIATEGGAAERKIPWWWCDALFMAPPAWARMAKATGERKYLDYMHKNWQRTYDQLWDKEHNLYFRDARYVTRKGANGQKVFWSRGEGWVMAGLARILDVIPADDPKRSFYVDQLKQMSASVAKIQNKDGLWHADMLDPASYPLPEVSGSAFFVYGIAYGINNGYLDAKTYRPVLEKAWAGIIKNVYADGRVGNIQQTGDEPAWYRPTSSYNYGIGAYLLAGAELKKMVSKQAAQGAAK
jgi:rhamnogalacturonyl hydrolase YesR